MNDKLTHGFKLIENENGMFLTYVLAGGIPCEGTDRISIARAMDKIKSSINEQMIDFTWKHEYLEEVEGEQSEEIIKIVNDELTHIENEGTEI